MNTKILQDLLDKRVSRREFLSYIGAGILAVVGITSFLKTIGGHTKKISEPSKFGYGGGTYGGKK